jgi:hypothetical protein
VDAEEDKEEGVRPPLVGVAHDGGLESAMEAFNQAVGSGVICSRAGEVDAAKSGEGLEEIGFELPPLVSGNRLRTAEASEPQCRQ